MAVTQHDFLNSAAADRNRILGGNAARLFKL